ncbi:MAG: hypothetical protein A2806_02400 [Candidatus Terrybacteria bacterium RIFCSPHIGHO2_01_FULL_48_17]|uniref:Orotidine 5'-phosphate decarboxylase domain-containing protein n=1 Tax=Candidatus Terrybacteria bacterium RIFCSPHIGHO2_01_FULL_48_17 TaxID=1802362 RepID=A0A1G2PJB7_9BACT|nr:MAG: hypothetical protein A2806_02400 [Candidatus Terrybacteria bacterium RIFCSPHIGHO2_01_FULL_48_17]OHA53593.1 MAG: hypothetical protein A3A30_00355 [Candidatus Terrybacteria bacterium RIFCSPLOWO2_01_FULL_48_14]
MPKLSRKQRYLQIALNSTLEEAREIIAVLPRNDRIIIEAGTPLIKRYGIQGIRTIVWWWTTHLQGGSFVPAFADTRPQLSPLGEMAMRLLAGMGKGIRTSRVATSHTGEPITPTPTIPYVVADLKTFDRGATEVDIAADAGASGAIASAAAPTETLNAFIQQCEARGLDSMIDTMNIEFPLSVLRALKKPPDVVVLHRGVDEETFNREKRLPHHEIHRIKGNYGILLAMAGGDTIREVQRAVFNDIDIVVVWKSFFQHSSETGQLADEFLKQIK